MKILYLYKDSQHVIIQAYCIVQSKIFFHHWPKHWYIISSYISSDQSRFIPKRNTVQPVRRALNRIYYIKYNKSPPASPTTRQLKYLKEWKVYFSKIVIRSKLIFIIIHLCSLAKAIISVNDWIWNLFQINTIEVTK